MDMPRLKSLTLAKYGSIANLARVLGWSYRRTSYAINSDPGRLTVEDAKALAKALGLDQNREEFDAIFMS